MALSQRERYIAMGLGIVIGGVVLWEVVISPFLDAREDLRKQTEAAVAKQAENTALFDKQERLKQVWKDMTQVGPDGQQGGLLADESAAESQALNASLDWAGTAGVNITAVKPERTTVVNQFEVIGFHLTGNGSTPAMARLLYSFETGNIPVRVDDMTLTPQKEGTDNLTIQMSLSTLCLKPADDSAPKPTVTYSGSEVRPWSE